MKPLNNFDTSRFLNEFWQKKPLIIRAGINNTEQLISPEELAGLACEENVESRLITHFDNQWQLTHGPLPEQTFLELPEKDWTVLVQSVDSYVPEVAELLEYFKFLPRWRIDDVMVSFASTGGTVSAHYDFYDVFLIQGKGSRKWQTGEFCTPDTLLLPDKPMNILADFTPKQEWILHPGDILYIPPKLSHYGVALEDCMTYSVGFRAPSKAGIVDLFATSVMSQLSSDNRYEDSPGTLNDNHMEVSQQTMDRMRNTIIELANNDEIMRTVIAEIATKGRHSDHDHRYDETPDWRNQLHQGDIIVRSPFSRFNYYSGENTALFADGVSYCASIELAKFICNFEQIAEENLHSVLEMQGAEALISELLNNGCLVFDEQLVM